MHDTPADYKAKVTYTVKMFKLDESPVVTAQLVALDEKAASTPRGVEIDMLAYTPKVCG